MLMLAITAIICSCGDSDDNTGRTTSSIELSDSVITMNVRNDSYLTIKGADVLDCKISSDNEFVAYANGYDNKIDIYGDHAGLATIKVTYGATTRTCKVKVNHLTNYIGSTVTSIGVSKKVLFELIKQYGLTGTYDTSKPNIINTTEQFSFGNVSTYYYIKNDTLYAIKKNITTSDNDINTRSNILTSLGEEFKYQTSYKETLSNIYPTNYVDATVFAIPSNSYTVYEQIKYDELYPGYSPKTSNCIYISNDLDIAKNHTFVNSTY